MYDSVENSGFIDGHENIATEFTDIEPLGECRNGYSQVFKAKRYGQWFVLKRLDPAVADAVGYRNLLHKEFLISVELNHPNIAKTHSMEPVEGLGLCIIEEFIDGEDWGSYFSRVRPDKQETLRIVNELCDALSYLHSKQYVHRDLKPSNVLITHNGHHIKLLDFGLADNDTFSIIKNVVGTARYAAPELAYTTKPDLRSDIFSLGVMLDGLPLRWSTLNRVSRRCRKQQPDKRYRSVEELRKALNRRSHSLLIATLVLSIILIALYITLSQTKNIKSTNNNQNPSGHPDYSENPDTLAPHKSHQQTAPSERSNQSDYSERSNPPNAPRQQPEPHNSTVLSPERVIEWAQGQWEFHRETALDTMHCCIVISGNHITYRRFDLLLYDGEITQIDIEKQRISGMKVFSCYFDMDREALYMLEMGGWITFKRTGEYQSHQTCTLS
ncbi:MAG: serine/threonine protein kinase [Bacteroidales bacterium]|nr:serine/threonine protein kinase [Bacteroidales bacterium]